ncbi:MAG TPA: hypothetical protein VIN72_02130 [Lutibacter sp.]
MKKPEKTSSSQLFEDNTIETTPLFAEAVDEVRDDSFYNVINLILISLFSLCLIYAIVDIVSQIFS